MEQPHCHSETDNWTVASISHNHTFEKMKTFWVLLASAVTTTLVTALDDVDAVNPPLMSKRGLTMEFNGVRVSYPQYLRLVRIQEKVTKLDQVINSLQRHRYVQKYYLVPFVHRISVYLL